MRSTAGSVVALWFGVASSLMAQQWSLDAVVTGSALGPSHCSASGGLQSQYTQIPNGPAVPGGWIASAGGAYANVTWANVTSGPAPVRFEILAATSCPASLGITQASAIVTFEMTIRSGLPTPQTGALVVRGDGSVDLDNDGTFDLSAADLPAAIPTVVPPAGLVIRVSVVSVAWSGFSGPGASDSASLDCEFFPGHTAVARHVDGWHSARLDVTGLGNDRWQLDAPGLGGQGLAPVLLILGFQATNVPIALGLTQLVSIDAWLPGGSFTFHLPPLPPGFELFAQGLLTTPTGYLLGTNSVRAAWF